MKILGIIKKKFNFKSLVDFGCGTGAWLKSANNLGLSKNNIVGIDKYYNVDKKFKFIKENVYNIKFKNKFDLAVCVEVAEHIEKNNTPKLVKCLTKASNIIIFSAALPNQSGDGHINCQSQQYWVELFKKHRYECIDFFRPIIWNDNKISDCYKQNMFLYVNKKEALNFKNKFSVKILHDIAHPSIINEHYLNRYRPLSKNAKISLR